MGEIEETLHMIDGWINPEGVNGAGIAVWHRGQLLAERYAGEARPGVPVDERTLFALASVTKPVTAATVMTAIDDGSIGLDEPVAPLLPVFDASAGPDGGEADPALERLRSTITVRQLLSHTSGLPEHLGVRRVRFREMPTLETLIDAMCRLPLQSAPGERVRYSNAGYGILARLCERVTSEPLWERTGLRVLEPLGLAADVVAQPGPYLDERLTVTQDTARAGTETESYNSAYWRDLGPPWAGLYGTVRAMATFAGAFLPGGTAFLTPSSMQEMTTDQAGGIPGGVESARIHWPVASWGLGWEVKGGKGNHWTGALTSPRTFCHWGQTGTLLWADPDHDVAVAVFATRTVLHGWPFNPPRWADLSDAIINALARK